MQFSNQPNLTPKEQAYDDLDGLLESNIVDKLKLQVDIFSSTDTEIRISKIKHFLSKNNFEPSVDNVFILENLLGAIMKKT
ncbi:hypothetical protein HC864_02600 [Candidatus Gracilibacteria bacterium]|nr:hypothetical protein [Candidatus Gracilibacteria bacterium]